MVHMWLPMGTKWYPMSNGKKVLISFASRSELKVADPPLYHRQAKGEPLRDFINRFNDEAPREGRGARKKRSERETRFKSEKDHERGRDRDRSRPIRKLAIYAAKCSPSTCLDVHRGKNMLKWPRKMKAIPGKRDERKYCHFHKDHGHDTKNASN
ncbi:hypothetical protein DH2020_022334 [Rehmannia glutinosa]|uniref:Uncharacterized protein n=1 Tax=Rehmannia glutinosa TaxID=99300 RepID=A0ABR0WGP7_REHGL